MSKQQVLEWDLVWNLRWVSQRTGQHSPNPPPRDILLMRQFHQSANFAQLSHSLYLANTPDNLCFSHRYQSNAPPLHAHLILSHPRHAPKLSHPIHVHRWDQASSQTRPQRCHAFHSCVRSAISEITENMFCLYHDFQLRHDSIFWLRALMIVPPSLLSFSPVFEYPWPSAGMTVRHLPWVWLFVTQTIVIAANSTFANDPTSGRFTPNTSLLLMERMIYQYNWVQALHWCVHFCLLQYGPLCYCVIT